MYAILISTAYDDSVTTIKVMYKTFLWYLVSVMIAVYTWAWLVFIREPKHVPVKLHTPININTWMGKSVRRIIRIWACTVSGNGTISRCLARWVKLAVVVSASCITGLCNVDTTVAAGLAYWLGCRSLGSSHSRLVYYRARSLAVLFCYRVWARLFVTSCAVLDLSF
jgi:hypothetical protein